MTLGRVCGDLCVSSFFEKHHLHGLCLTSMGLIFWGESKLDARQMSLVILSELPRTVVNCGRWKMDVCMNMEQRGGWGMCTKRRCSFTKRTHLGRGFKYFLFSPLPAKTIPFDDCAYFSNGWLNQYSTEM